MFFLSSDNQSNNIYTHIYVFLIPLKTYFLRSNKGSFIYAATQLFLTHYDKRLLLNGYMLASNFSIPKGYILIINNK